MCAHVQEAVYVVPLQAYIEKLGAWPRHATEASAPTAEKGIPLLIFHGPENSRSRASFWRNEPRFPQRQKQQQQPRYRDGTAATQVFAAETPSLRGFGGGRVCPFSLAFPRLEITR